MKNLRNIISGLLIASSAYFGIGNYRAFAQPEVQWERAYGGSSFEKFRSVKQTSDGGYIASGTTTSFGEGERDIYLVKTDSNGNLEWQNVFGGREFDDGGEVIQTNDGGYAITGTTTSFGAGDRDAILIKTDSNGNLEWQRTFGYFNKDEGTPLKQTADGGYILSGETSSFGFGREDAYLVKTDSNGNLEWENSYGGSRFDNGGGDLQITNDGGYIIIGSTDSFGVGRDMYLIKTDSNGNLEWENNFGRNNLDRGLSVKQTSDGGYIAAGETYSFSGGSRNMYLVKTDSNGSLEWENNFGGIKDVDAVSIQITSDRGYILAGRNWTDRDIYLVKTDSNGNLEWEENIGGIGDEQGLWVERTRDNGYVISGHTTSFGFGSEDAYLVKLESLFPPIEALVDIKPETLNMRSRRKWITAYIQLPQEFDIKNIELDSIALTNISNNNYNFSFNQFIDLNFTPQINDENLDGVFDLTVKFNYSELLPNLCTGNLTINLEGILTSGQKFIGEDNIRIIG